MFLGLFWLLQPADHVCPWSIIQKGHVKSFFHCFRIPGKWIVFDDVHQFPGFYNKGGDFKPIFFLSFLFNLPGQLNRIAFGTFEYEVSTLDIGSNILPSQFHQMGFQVSHGDFLLAAYINAPEQSNIGFHLSMVLW